MFDLNDAVKQWRKTIRKNPSLEDGYIAELESHLRDDIEHRMHQGSTAEEAFDQAVAIIGSADRIGAEYYKTDTRHISGRPSWQAHPWAPALFVNYWRIACRKMTRHKAFSLLNIMGLAIGMACCILILLYVRYELSYDHYHPQIEQMFRVVQHQPDLDYLSSEYSAMTPGPLAPALMSAYPEVHTAIRLARRANVLVSHGERSFLEEEFSFADPELFDVFSFELLKGNRGTALHDPDAVIISETMAVKYFADEDPVGKTLTYQNDRSFTVTGVLKNIPGNSHFTMSFIAPFSAYAAMRGNDLQEWRPAWFCYTYCVLEEDADINVLEEKLVLLEARVDAQNIYNRSFKFQPVKDIHLNSRMNREISNNSEMTYIYVFSSIAFFILIMACINYMNLTTARSAQRVREVGVRKVVGAQKIQLIQQFIGESVTFTVFAFIVSMGLVLTVLPVFNAFVERNITMEVMNHASFLFLLFTIVLLTGIISGSYPAFFISSIKPISILTHAHKKSEGISLRNMLVVVQFSIAIILILSTLVVKNQLAYIKNEDVGYNREQIITLRGRGIADQKSLETLKAELLKHPNIAQVSSSFDLPNDISSFDKPVWVGRRDDPEMTMYFNMVDYDFVDFYNLDIVEGRNFSRAFSSDENGALLLNEAAVEALGWESPLGEQLETWTDTPEVVGVVRDFNFHSLHSRIEPMFMVLSQNNRRYISVKIQSTATMAETIQYIETQMRVFAPGYPFEYQFLDDVFESAYRSEQKLEQMFNLFAALAMIISCLGLLGLAAFTAEQRTKEIGIRKVLGASVPAIVIMLSKDLALWVLAANIIAWPVAYIIMRQWLQNFAYRVDLGVELFILGGGLALMIALMTVGYQALKAAWGNPVDALKYE